MSERREHTPIGEMDETEARMALLRVFVDTLGIVPEDAQRRDDGGYVVSLHVTPDQVRGLDCSECGMPAAHNFHRPDLECDDPDEHMRTHPNVLHHPLQIGAPPEPSR